MPLVLLWFLFGDLRIFGLVYVSTVCIGVVSYMTGSYFLIFQILFVRGKAKNPIFGRGSLPFPSVALRIDFSAAPRQGSGLVCEVFRVPDL